MGRQHKREFLPQPPGGRIDPGQPSCYSAYRCEGKHHAVPNALWMEGVARNEYTGTFVS